MRNKAIREFARIMTLSISVLLVLYLNTSAWGSLLKSLQTGTYTEVLTWLMWAYIQLASWFLLVNIFHPVYTLIFNTQTKVRHPKTIIKLGERFRGVGLPAPQFFLWSQGRGPSPSCFCGFSILPRPFGSLLSMPESLFNKLSLDEVDMFICAEAAQSKFGNRFMWVQIFLIRFFIALFFAWTILFYPYLEFLPNQFHIWVKSAFAATAIASLFFAYRWMRRRYIHATDFQALRIFKLNPEQYFSAQEKIDSKSVIVSVAERREYYQQLVKSTKPDAQKLPPISLFEKVITPVGLAIIALNWIGPYSFYSYYYKPQRIMTETIQSLDYATFRTLVADKNNLKVRDPFLDGATPPLIAAATGELHMLYSILVAGGSMQDTDDLGRGILYYAMQTSEREKAVRYILQGTIDVNQVDKFGKTPLDYARYYKSLEIENAIKEKGAKNIPRSPSSAQAAQSSHKRFLDKLFIF